MYSKHNISKRGSQIPGHKHVATSRALEQSTLQMLRPLFKIVDLNTDSVSPCIHVRVPVYLCAHVSVLAALSCPWTCRRLAWGQSSCPWRVQAVSLGLAFSVCGEHAMCTCHQVAHLYLSTSLPPLYLSTSLPLYLFTSLHHYLSTSEPIYLSTSVPLYLSASPPLHLSTSLPLYLSTSPPLHLSTSLPLYLSTSLPLYLSTSLPLYLSSLSLSLSLSLCWARPRVSHRACASPGFCPSRAVPSPALPCPRPTLRL